MAVDVIWAHTGGGDIEDPHIYLSTLNQTFSVLPYIEIGQTDLVGCYAKQVEEKNVTLFLVKFILLFKSIEKGVILSAKNTHGGHNLLKRLI